MPSFENSWGGTHYVVDGSGPPVLLIHGVGAQLGNWDGVAAVLARTFKVVRYDLRGHGKSSKVPGPYSLDLFVEDAVALLEHLGIARAHVAGHSLGGMIAITLAARHPERVDRLAILSAAAGRTEEERRRVMERIALIAHGIPGDHFKNSLSRWFTDEFRAANPGLMEEYAARNKENDPACYAAAYAVLATGEVGPDLPRVTAPALIVTGEHDLGSNPRMAGFIHAGIAHSELRVLPRLRHSILIEAPLLVAGQLGQFFQARPVP
ncbi:MAG TPA: alpha/beta fold hydrolase [Stellaceae bacterium]|nr:alpha/beta fold hydrolase [Stellaceae bacterium]